MISIDELSYRYPGHDEYVLSDVDLHVQASEIVLLSGPSGSGKSTLVRCLNGLIPHSLGGELEGTVDVCDYDVHTTSRSELTRRVGLVFQNPDTQFVATTVEDEIAFGLENCCVPRREMTERITRALSMVGLLGFEQRRIDELSGGEKQRVAIACQLVLNPRILVFDEPTANLDPQGTEEVFAVMRRLADDGHTIVVIEHRYESLLDLVDRMVVLGADGGVAVSGEPTDVFSEHIDVLRSEGVRLPQLTRLAHRLRTNARWPDSRPLPTTIGEATDVLSEICPESCPTLETDHSSELSVSSPVEPNDSETAIEIRGLNFSYEDQSSRTVLSDVKLRVPAGCFLAIVGPNGAGKSTLAKHCVGIGSPPEETVYVDGQDVTAESPAKLSQRIGYVFQNPEHQFVTASVRTELGYGPRQRGLDAETVERRVDRALERFSLQHVANQNPYTLSHGEKRRLSVATMLIDDQETILLDEPTFGQDRSNTERLMETLSAFRDAGRTIVLLTHDMEIVAEYATHVVVLINGNVQFRGTPTKLFSDSELLTEARLSKPPVAILADSLWGEDTEITTVDGMYNACTSMGAENRKRSGFVPENDTTNERSEPTSDRIQ